ncbi:hypothetical protein SAMN05444166_4226 [Singulisphaera sp. GP187]|uniref:hypothetical protein n=1 Tax=Singulisphaera sp. GP187 TaxID=1882752 RepID=UPI0009285E03|nr:hypothetical protein [Singulisphaera sp. GP187]SIO37900.1 hypothetical protein SAMN05444166_4226 [Singulisphaera sp. GP187]
MDGRYQEDEIDPVLRTIVNHWMTKIIHARDHKRKVFQDAANECMSFFNGPRSWEDVMGGVSGLNRRDDMIDTTFQVSVNKTFEFVTIFGPALYYENPVRTVKPRMPVIVPPQFFGGNVLLYQSILQEENLRVQTEGLTSVLIESYLNWTPAEFQLEQESRQAIDEALIKGRGCLWTELYSPPGTDMKVPKSSFDSVDHLFCDPDAQGFKDATWIARKCIHPVWQVERDCGLRPGSIKGNMESQAKQADIATDEDQEYDRKRGFTNDLLVYYKIYSKMGIGGRLQGLTKSLREPLEMFGDYVYLVVADGIPYPLNLSPDSTNDPAFASDPNAVFAKVAWPTPFWGADEWPVTELDFHKIPNSTWPMPHLKAGMGELKFLNWCMSFLMGKVRNTTRDFIAIMKSAGEEIKTNILEGKDLTFLELDSGHGSIAELVQFLQHPEVNGDIWKMIEAVESNFDKRVGLTELMYGQQGATQIRSAQEAQLRNANMNVRPDDMRKCVVAWMARVALKEAMCARYHLIPQDVQPVLGGMAAWAWGQFVSTRDINKASRQLEYRIEAGSTQRPNKELEIQTMNTAFTSLAPLLQTYSQQTMDMSPLNNLLSDFAKSLDLDPARYQLSQPLPPPAPHAAPGEEGGSGDQQQAV